MNHSLKLLAQQARHSSKDVWSLALINHGEDYEIIKSLIKAVGQGLKDVQQSVLEVKTCLRTYEITIEFHLCCDWKFLALVLGLKAATAKFFCLFCTCSKSRAAWLNLLPIPEAQNG